MSTNKKYSLKAELKDEESSFFLESITWFNATGGSDKHLELRIYLVDEFNEVTNQTIKVKAELVFDDNGDKVPNVPVVKKNNILLFEIKKDSTFSVGKIPAIIRFRINDVSSSYQHRKFRVLVSPDIDSTSSMVSSVSSVPILVKSKKGNSKRDRENEEQFSAGIISQSGNKIKKTVSMSSYSQYSNPFKKSISDSESDKDSHSADPLGKALELYRSSSEPASRCFTLLPSHTNAALSNATHNTGLFQFSSDNMFINQPSQSFNLPCNHTELNMPLSSSQSSSQYFISHDMEINDDFSPTSHSNCNSKSVTVPVVTPPASTLDYQSTDSTANSENSFSFENELDELKKDAEHFISKLYIVQDAITTGEGVCNNEQLKKWFKILKTTKMLNEASAQLSKFVEHVDNLANVMEDCQLPTTVTSTLSQSFLLPSVSNSTIFQSVNNTNAMNTTANLNGINIPTSSFFTADTVSTDVTGSMKKTMSSVHMNRGLSKQNNKNKNISKNSSYQTVNNLAIQPLTAVGGMEENGVVDTFLHANEVATAGSALLSLCRT